MKKIILLLCVFCCADRLAVMAQSFKLMRYDEDYSAFKSDTTGKFYNTIKYIGLSANRGVYLSVGGEIRYEYAGKFDENWKAGQGYNYSFLQRYSLNTNLQLGSNLRVFAQINSGLENGSKYGAAPVDEDKLNIQDLFAELKVWQKEDQSFSVRVGRQELNYGTGRLISVREGTNVRLYFTGAKAMYKAESFTVDGFAMMADDVYSGVFDNKPTHQVNLWGTYATLIIPKGGNFDFYYLGTKNNNKRFEEGTANETRHTVATRYWKNGGGFIYNLEGAYQFGKFGKGNINAWTAAIDFGYVFDKIKGMPSINLRNDYISGDSKKGDGNLQTFNPLYPRGGYFGFNPLIGPANLIDLHPYATYNLFNRLDLQADVVFNWRYSTQDGLYRPSGNFNLPGAASAQKYIGTTYLASAEYRFSKFFTLSSGAQYFKTGSFLQEVVQPTASSWFYNLQFTFKF
ncbi:alginate export family protein [Mucilaginibacter sp. CAU 1740]|uniref:alginate export family protein n=1 Tax=Mucilaginibacter sp. CAU 1740 TaxID=3140365 RepID=UPI00325BDB57